VRKYIVLICIITLFAGFVRFLHLGKLPVSLHRDEAFLGYNGYSILKTGKDMSGKSFPLHLESFIYSPAGYSYLTIPEFSVFGLSPFSLRFPSAFFGTLTTVLIFILTLLLFQDYKKKTVLASLSAIFFAISPWSIVLSRTATENTVVVFFIVLGIVLFLLWVGIKRFFLLLLSFAAFAFTLSLYQAPRVFLPLFIPFLVILFWDRIGNWRKGIVIATLFFITIILSLALILSSDKLSLRIRTVSVLADKGTQLSIDERIREDGVSQIHPLLSRLLNNKIMGYGSVVVNNYFSHLSYQFFFLDNFLPLRYNVPGIGIFYLYQLPLIIIGVWSVSKKFKKQAFFLVGWILISPIGSALTSDDVPNIQRTLQMLPPVLIFISYGCIELYYFFFKKIRPFILYAGILTISLSFCFFIYNYTVHAVHHRSWFRQEGYEELVNFVNSRIPRYSKAVVTNRESAPAIFFLTYGKYDPEKFQNETKNSKFRDFDRINFWKYQFSEEECPLSFVPEKKILTGAPGILYVNSGNCSILKDSRVKYIKTIKRPDGSTVFRVLEVINT